METRFVLEQGPSWAEEPSLKLSMINTVSESHERRDSFVFPERLLGELIELLGRGTSTYGTGILREDNDNE